jgi:putative transposase
LPARCDDAARGPGDKWYLDEVFIRIQGVRHYPWRAVDQDGVVPDILVQPRRDAKAAKRFFRQLLKGLQYVPRVIVTDKPRSHGVAQRQSLPKVEHRQSRYLNNRGKLTSTDTAPRTPDATIQIARAGPVLSLRARVHLQSFSPTTTPTRSPAYRTIRTEAFNVWHQETCAQQAA